MPRLPPSLFKQAAAISPHLARLLPACRDLPSALNELRWIREHVYSTSGSHARPFEEQVKALCEKRGKGVPLQYVLGNQPFGVLDIKCRPGVLIPRPEPEAYTTHLARLVNAAHFSHLFQGQANPNSAATQSLTVLDFCTGTGCIALLLFALLRQRHPALHVHGIDISPAAVRLARENARHNSQIGHLGPPPDSDAGRDQDHRPYQTARFTRGDIFAPLSNDILSRRCDILVCNPPYISTQGFAHDTARSVRNFEPKLAQVPSTPSDDRGSSASPSCRPEDVFYARLLDIARELRPKLMLFEVGDLQQAVRVVKMALQGEGRETGGQMVEIWRDWPDTAAAADESPFVEVCGRPVRIQGSGCGRSVFIVRE